MITAVRNDMDIDSGLLWSVKAKEHARRRPGEAA